MANQLLEVKNLDVWYGDFQVLREVSLHVEEGTIVALVGANGAGKTTLLKTISGLLQPRKGEIFFSGKPLHNLKPQDIVDRGIIHVPEGRRLFASLTVLENLRLGAYIRRARINFDESLKRAYDLFPVLEKRKNQKAGTLSGGEQQMLAIGRAIMAQPKLIMLDEPSLGLSPILVKTIFQLISTLNEQKATILLIEQNINQTLKIAHQAFVLKIGKIVMSGRGDELLANEEIRKAYIGERAGKR
ncbi:MAG TPA: ABC transporter ATP-binding protein [Dehalococcoidales bacterium]|nr:ABC transporter ATP-binding protein [Dehalococcoidales bacterium]